jgi:hypothetical protein
MIIVSRETLLISFDGESVFRKCDLMHRMIFRECILRQPKESDKMMHCYAMCQFKKSNCTSPVVWISSCSSYRIGFDNGPHEAGCDED